MIALDSTKVTCRQTISVFFIILFPRLTCLICVSSGGRVRAPLLALPQLILVAVFFLFLSSFREKLGVVRAGRNRQNCWFWAPDLSSFWPEVFYSLGLAFSLGRGSVHWSVFSVVVLINVPADKSLYLCLGLSRCSFLNQGALNVQLLAVFINPQSNRWPQVFVKVLTQNFFW